MKRLTGAVAASPLVHPVLFAAYPVLFLWSHNASQGASASQAVPVLVVVVACALALFAVLWLMSRSVSRAAIATTAIVTLVTTFGRVEGYLKVAEGSTRELGLLLGWLLLIVVVVVLAIRSGNPSGVLTRTLNLIGAVLVALNLVAIVASSPAAAGGISFSFPAPPGHLDPTASGSEPDVYYLIFDRYAGARTLQDLYGFDNSAFYRWLASRGFVVTHDGLANYPQTTHSLASSLNMDYLDDLASAEGEASADWGPLQKTLQSPSVARAFQSMGYAYEHVPSWWAGTWFDPTADANYTYGSYTEFSGAFVSTTALPAVARQFGIGPSADFPHQQWERVHYQMSVLGRIANDPRPTFTFAHFTLLHPPYVFHADGSYAAPDPARPVPDAYIDQFRYTNGAIESIVSNLQGSPGPQPIIVLQSDEGPHVPALDAMPTLPPWSSASQSDLERTLRIVNAYYLPGRPAEAPYPTITPVNTFRLILDDYFGANLPLLPDRILIFDDPGHPYRFTDVTGRLR